MPAPPLRVEPIDDILRAGFDRIRTELHIEDPFPADAIAEANAAAANPAALGPRDDLRDLPFITVDPAGSTDLDQAMHLEREGDGWVVHYAIADVAAFVAPGGAVDRDARTRGVTIYLPDHRTPLHPPVLSEGAASLLPGRERPALAWRIALDDRGEVTDVAFRRAIVRSRRAYDYVEVQQAIDTATGDEQLLLLRDIGSAREARQLARGGLDLHLPEQVVVAGADGYELAYRAPVASEGWNAQLSLLAGECAAALMLDAGVGILRTLPPPNPGTVERLRRHARALHVPWPTDVGYAPFVRALDPHDPDQAALIVQSATLARGAGYVGFTARPTGDVTHAAVTAPYAHVTAPLRRLADRFGNEIALAAAASRRAPEWATSQVVEVAELMEKATSREHAADRMAVDLVEAAVLSACVGSEVDGVVVNVDNHKAVVQLTAPAVVTAVAAGSLDLGQEVRLRVQAADVAAGHVDLVRV
jgi:exoribonuclease R